MTRKEAIKIDTDFEVDLDEGTGDFCVFGNESGFAYASFASKDDADESAEKMRKERDSNRS